MLARPQGPESHPFGFCQGCPALHTVQHNTKCCRQRLDLQRAGSKRKMLRVHIMKSPPTNRCIQLLADVPHSLIDLQLSKELKELIKTSCATGRTHQELLQRCAGWSAGSAGASTAGKVRRNITAKRVVCTVRLSDYAIPAVIVVQVQIHTQSSRYFEGACYWCTCILAGTGHAAAGARNMNEASNAGRLGRNGNLALAHQQRLVKFAGALERLDAACQQSVTEGPARPSQCVGLVLMRPSLDFADS